jgi:predicted transcriptional regulator
MVYHDNEIGAALRYHEILDRIAIIGWGNYSIWWIVMTLILIVAGVIIGIVGGILLYFILGFLVILLGYSYLIIFQARSVALIFESMRK